MKKISNDTNVIIKTGIIYEIVQLTRQHFFNKKTIPETRKLTQYKQDLPKRPPYVEAHDVEPWECWVKGKEQHVPWEMKIYCSEKLLWTFFSLEILKK